MAAHNIKLTGKFSTEKPTIEIGDKKYQIDDSVESVLAFQEAATSGFEGMLNALKGALGDEAYEELNIPKMAFGNLQILSTGILAAQSNVSYDEAAARFRRSAEQG
ncbi:hypothetical protein [Paenibacillus ihuae]|uniref:hypothetical protein n=1 Tax=Paenibacillus ihuae TaxID=1232431 RepID=UPI0006D556C1|nr:hypothetical protein [Paenibacillus ihuae]